MASASDFVAAEHKRPTNAAGAKTLHMRKESYINLPLDALLHACVRRIEHETDKMRFIDFARRLEELYRCRVASRTKRLRKSFQLFVTGSSDLGYDSDALAQEEDLFLESIHDTLTLANYRLITKGEYKDAIDSEYTLSLDLEMDRRGLDSTFIERFLDSHKDDAAMTDAADLNRSVLVYHRGASIDKADGLFVMEKVDYVFSCVFALLFSSLSIIWTLLRPWTYVSTMKRLVRHRTGLRQKTVVVDAAAEPEQTHIVVRQSLHDQLSASFLPTLFSRVDLQEPTFKDIVVIYRTKEQSEEGTDGQPKPISVKSFRDIPRADFEIILPAQRPKTRALDLFKLLMAIALGVTTLSVKLTQLVEEEKAEGDWREEPITEKLQDVLPLLIALGSYIGKILVQFQAQQARYNNLMTQYLYHKTADSNDGVRTQLLESTLNQEIKEALLAYFFLWKTSATSLRELDEEIEDFFRELGEDLDFEVDDAVRKLVDDGFVSIDTTTLSVVSTLRVSTISRAISRLEELWEGYFVNPEQECPFCPYLDGSPHGILPAISKP